METTTSIQELPKDVIIVADDITPEPCKDIAAELENCYTKISKLENSLKESLLANKELDDAIQKIAFLFGVEGKPALEIAEIADKVEQCLQ